MQRVVVSGTLHSVRVQLAGTATKNKYKQYTKQPAGVGNSANSANSQLEKSRSEKRERGLQ
jgi:hypothetical protein